MTAKATLAISKHTVLTDSAYFDVGLIARKPVLGLPPGQLSPTQLQRIASAENFFPHKAGFAIIIMPGSRKFC